MNKLSFKNWPLFVKLTALILVSVLPLVLVYAMKTLPKIEDKIYEGKRNDLRHLTESASGIMKAYNDKVSSGSMTLEAAQKAASDEINAFRYEGKEYFFVYDMKRNLISLGSEIDMQNPLLHSMPFGSAVEEVYRQVMLVTIKEIYGYAALAAFGILIISLCTRYKNILKLKMPR